MQRDALEGSIRGGGSVRGGGLFNRLRAATDAVQQSGVANDRSAPLRDNFFASSKFCFPHNLVGAAAAVKDLHPAVHKAILYARDVMRKAIDKVQTLVRMQNGMSMDDIAEKQLMVGRELSDGNGPQSWFEMAADEISVDFFNIAGPVSTHARFSDVVNRAVSERMHHVQ